MSSIIHLKNGRVATGDQLVPKSIWVDPVTGVFTSAPDPAATVTEVDLKDRIIAPGFIDLQINGAYGFDFSENISSTQNGMSYMDRYMEVRRKLIATGTTSFLPTMTSQMPDRYHQNLPFLGPSKSRDPFDGTESLGAHCEGPFFAHNRIGVHLSDAVEASGTRSDPETVLRTYGAANLIGDMGRAPGHNEPGFIPSNVRMVTLAPERVGALDTIKQLSSEGVVMSIGHMAADFHQARAGIEAGASMITHLYNQMNPHHHREPGPLGIITGGADLPNRLEGERPVDDGEKITKRGHRPYFGIIADGNHVHPASLRLAHLAHPEGVILVTDALLLLGGEDGTIDWLTRRLTKKGVSVKLEGTNIIAGSCVTLLQCLNNFRRWTGVSIAAAIQAVTSRPAAVLGLDHMKGTFRPGADADFVVLSEIFSPDQPISEIEVEQVWKFGVNIIDKGNN